MSYKLFVEGGGNRQSKAIDIECQRGFRALLGKLGLGGRMPRIVPCGARDRAFRDFRTALANGERALLLVDSEDEVTVQSPWVHLHQHDGWARPGGAKDEDCHLMTQCMEAWLLADRTALAGFFGSRFRANAIPTWPNVETIRKQDLLATLDRATRDCLQCRWIS